MAENKKSVLITGGAGFVGANLIRYFLRDGYTIHLLTRENTNLQNIQTIREKIDLYTIDLQNLSQLKRIVKKISPMYIFHLASYGNTRIQQDVNEMLRTNVMGLHNLLEATKIINYKLFVNAGSSSEYGFKNFPMKETDMLEPISFYAATKASATHLCRAFALQHKKPILTFRFFSIYGPFEDKKRFIPTAIHNALLGKLVALTKNEVRHDFIFVDDICKGYSLAIKNSKNNFQGEILNLGTGHHYTNNEVIKTLSSVMKKNIKTKKGAYDTHLWDTNYWKADISKAKEVLSWTPTYTLRKGLQTTVNWYTTQQNELS